MKYEKCLSRPSTLYYQQEGLRNTPAHFTLGGWLLVSLWYSLELCYWMGVKHTIYTNVTFYSMLKISILYIKYYYMIVSISLFRLQKRKSSWHGIISNMKTKSAVVQITFCMCHGNYQHAGLYCWLSSRHTLQESKEVTQ